MTSDTPMQTITISVEEYDILIAAYESYKALQIELLGIIANLGDAKARLESARMRRIGGGHVKEDGTATAV